MLLNGFKSILNSAIFKKLWLGATAEQGTLPTLKDLNFSENGSESAKEQASKGSHTHNY